MDRRLTVRRGCLLLGSSVRVTGLVRVVVNVTSSVDTNGGLVSPTGEEEGLEQGTRLVKVRSLSWFGP